MNQWAKTINEFICEMWIGDSLKEQTFVICGIWLNDSTNNNKKKKWSVKYESMQTNLFVKCESVNQQISSFVGHESSKWIKKWINEWILRTSNHSVVNLESVNQ